MANPESKTVETLLKLFTSAVDTNQVMVKNLTQINEKTDHMQKDLGYIANQFKDGFKRDIIKEVSARTKMIILSVVGGISLLFIAINYIMLKAIN